MLKFSVFSIISESEKSFRKILIEERVRSISNNYEANKVFLFNLSIYVNADQYIAYQKVIYIARVNNALSTKLYKHICSWY